LKDKYLLDVGKALKIKRFRFPKRRRKATEKDTEKHQTLENQGLAKILFGFSVFRKTDPTSPPDPPTDQSVSWHDFCRQDPQQFYTFFYHRNNRKIKNKKQRKPLRE
jgi:hypothetical protein